MSCKEHPLGGILFHFMPNRISNPIVCNGIFGYHICVGTRILLGFPNVPKKIFGRKLHVVLTCALLCMSRTSSACLKVPQLLVQQQLLPLLSRRQAQLFQQLPAKDRRRPQQWDLPQLLPSQKQLPRKNHGHQVNKTCTFQLCVLY